MISSRKKPKMVSKEKGLKVLWMKLISTCQGRCQEKMSFGV